MTQYDYTKIPCAIDSLGQTIELSGITSATFSHCDLFGAALTIYFEGDLSANDKTTLDNIVAAHTGIALTPDFNERSATALTSVNSSTYLTLNGMTSPPLLAGTYLVNFNGNFGSNSPLLTTPGISIALFNDGVLVPGTEIRQDSTQGGLFGQSPIGLGFNSSVMVAKNKILEVKWRNNGSGNIISCTSRVLDILKVR